MKKQLKLFIAFIFALFSISISAVESLQELCANQVARGLVSDAMLEQFKNNSHFIQEMGLNNESQNLKDLIKNAILSSYRPAVNTLRLNDWILRKATPSILFVRGYVESVHWSPNGNQIATTVSTDSTVKIWNAQNGTPLHSLAGHNGWITSVAWSPKGDRIAIGALNDSTTKIWDAQNGILLHTLSGCNAIVWSPNGNRIATTSHDGTVKIWNTQNGTLLHTHNYNAWSVVWSPDLNRIASVSLYIAKIWNAQNGTILHTIPGSNASVDWSPDGNRIATVSGYTVKIWNAQSITLLHTLPGYDYRKAVRSISWSPDNNRIATVSWHGTVEIWDPENGILLHTLTTHDCGNTDWKMPVAWSPDGSHIAIGLTDGTTKVFDSETATLLHMLFSNYNNWKVTSVAWSPDGERIAIGSWDKTVRILNLPQLKNLSFEQTLFLALVYNNYHHNGQPLILNYDHEHLHNIYQTLSAAIQNIIRSNIRLLKKHKK